MDTNPKDKMISPLDNVPGINEIIHIADIHPVVYFLLKNGNIVYIGQTINWPSRLTTHRDQLGDQFDAMALLPTSLDELHKTERKYIEMFCPSLNRQFTPARSSGAKWDCRPVQDEETLLAFVKYLGLEYPQDLRSLSESDLLTVRGFGEASLMFVRNYLKQLAM